MSKFIRPSLMNHLIRFIFHANDTELNQIIHTVNRRYQSIHPDWDIIYLALPKNNPAERERLLQKAISVISEK